MIYLPHVNATGKLCESFAAKQLIQNNANKMKYVFKNIGEVCTLIGDCILFKEKLFLNIFKKSKCYGISAFLCICHFASPEGDFRFQEVISSDEHKKMPHH